MLVPGGAAVVAAVSPAIALLATLTAGGATQDESAFAVDQAPSAVATASASGVGRSESKQGRIRSGEGKGAMGNPGATPRLTA